MRIQLLLALSAASAVSAQTPVDLLIRNGTVVDGTGGAARVADVGIRGDRIVFVGSSANVTAWPSMMCEGL